MVEAIAAIGYSNVCADKLKELKAGVIDASNKLKALERDALSRNAESVEGYRGAEINTAMKMGAQTIYALAPA